MRISTFVALSALAVCIPATRAPAQSIGISIQLGPVRAVSLYSTAQYGDWRASYQQWQPTTLYVVNGQYYDRESSGARAVIVYRRDNDYFLPPQDAAWVGVDKRYDYKHKPHKADYDNKGRGRGRGHEKR